jgi:hypothetical protein
MGGDFEEKLANKNFGWNRIFCPQLPMNLDFGLYF